MKENAVPMHLVSTFNMLKKAFPNGIDYTSYYPVVSLLYNYMSDRNLADIISYFVDKESSNILNDIYSINSVNIDDAEKNLVYEALKLAGYEEWIKKE